MSTTFKSYSQERMLRLCEMLGLDPSIVMTIDVHVEAGHCMTYTVKFVDKPPAPLISTQQPSEPGYL